MRFEATDTNLQEIDSQLKDILVILNLESGNPSQQLPIDHGHDYVLVNPTPFTVPVAGEENH